jgi:alpha-1,2-mannosyltransferase
MAWLPAWLAAALWTAGSVAALAAVVALALRALGRPAGGWPVALVAAGALALEPVWQNLTFGQVNLFLMLAILVDVVRPERRWSGVLVGLAAGVKLEPLVLVAMLPLVGRSGAAARALVTFAATVLAGFALMPSPAAAYWKDDLTRASRVGPPELAHNQSVYGALTRLLGEPPPTVLWLAVAGPLAVAVLMVGAAWWRRGERVLGACLGALAMLVASPVSWSHHWVWALPLALVLWERNRGVAVTWTAVFVTRPILWPPWGGHRELRWGPVDQLAGNAYLLAAVAVAAWAAVTLLRRPAQPAPASPVAPVGGRGGAQAAAGAEPGSTTGSHAQSSPHDRKVCRAWPHRGQGRS